MHIHTHTHIKSHITTKAIPGEYPGTVLMNGLVNFILMININFIVCVIDFHIFPVVSVC